MLTTVGAALKLGATVELFEIEGAYWYSLEREPRTLPVIRVMDDAGTRYYLDATSGGLLQVSDAAARDYRWWHAALHRLDFAGLLRTRPARDVLMWLLLLGVTTITATGFWLSVKRVLGK